MDFKEGMLLKQHSTTVQLYSSLKTAASEVPDWPKTCVVPVLCTVGMQSSGKTTFIEALVRFRIGTTCSGTGTRCPVRYVLREGEDYFSVGGNRLDHRQDIQKAVEAHMRGLAERSCESDRFSLEELKVEITSAQLPDLDITDLPGLKTNGVGAEEIKSVVRGCVQSESARPIVLVKATENVETQADVELLKEVGIDPQKKNAIFIVNYFNDQLYKFARISDLNEYCKGYVQRYHHVFFCMLIYNIEAKMQKDKLDFEGESIYYRELPYKEKEAFQAKVAQCTKDQELHVKHVTNNFGIEHAVHKMQSIIFDFVHEQGRKFADRISPLNDRYVCRVRELERNLRECNSDYIKEQREKYVEKFGLTIRCLQRCKTGLDLNLPHFEPMTAGQTFDEEKIRVKELIGECLLSDEKGSKVPERLLTDKKLTADASLWRLCDVFDYAILTQITIVPVKENEACSISGYAPGDMPGAFDRLQVVKEVATRPLKEVADQVPKFLNHVLAIYEKSVDIVVKLLKTHPGHTDMLSKQVAASYKTNLKRLIDESMDSFRNAVFEKSSFMVADFETRRCQRWTLGGQRRALPLNPPLFGIPTIYVRYICCCAEVMSQQAMTPGPEKDAVALALTFARQLYEKRLKELRIEPNMLEVNEEAAQHCDRLKRELITQLKNKTAHSLFRKLDGPIIRTVRDELAQQMRNVDAKQIDEDTKAKAAEMKKDLEEARQHLVQIDNVLECISALRDESWTMGTSA